MKTSTFFAGLLALALWGCSGGGSATAEAAEAGADTVATQEKEPLRPAMLRRNSRISFEKKLRTGKIEFYLSSPNTPEMNTLVVASSGFENRNDTFQLEVAGLAFDAQLADLDKDGYPEVYAFTRSAGSDSTHYAYGFASNRNLSYGPVNVRELAVNPDMAKGFNGQDRFYFEGGALKRSFPLFQDGRPTGQKRIVTYKLYPGESSFILEPATAEVAAGE